ncbi:toll/interleukin-1 receptor domain-containing protein [Frankia sp. CNm7]|uniref:Toll/interleukin-1 receptor domain-containing protein n=1 Tax=Frankia nepalensis TaxID=1836974 RepID=A0A937R9H6_9ACTN|nr:toll/interleukin-1 receptor domain-containing protein [Frankia nepalensis]MBL7509771.1 toll/interleukin-1 receptor domain-containing protein [Frankia nepalensis]MBL7522157.1 toll/interleukin-1 receptor domain-containing protein [Frankia nepalensis]MBL7627891.1 toll/interleukin-1 receptor domain-containing protein [Frankia nepalensis]
MGSVLLDAGYQVLIDAWEVVPGTNQVQVADRAVREADRTLVVLSASYGEELLTGAIWRTVFSADLAGRGRRLLTAMVDDTEVTGLLAHTVPIELAGLDETAARARLLTGVAAAVAGTAAPRGPAPFPAAGVTGRHRRPVGAGDRIWVEALPAPPSARFVERPGLTRAGHRVRDVGLPRRGPALGAVLASGPEGRGRRGA